MLKRQPCPIAILASLMLPTCLWATDKPSAQKWNTAYKGHIASRAEYQRIVVENKLKTYIWGGIRVQQGRKKAYVKEASYKVGDTVHMDFHIGVVDQNLKLNTKGFPAPTPVLHLLKDGDPYKQVKFSKGAC